MAHQAIYRKWRPTVFEDIVGQGHITRTLKNQIINNKLGHAYLFCGTRGTGKTTCAKVLSRAVNCLNPNDGSPCNECTVCKGILDGSIMDVKEIDAASNNGVDNIREIREDVQYVSANTKYTVYIIDEVHMLSTGAFNALLKTLEEPPENVIFILATTEAHKIPQTILSRCQRFDFKRIRPEDITLRMKEIAKGDNFKITDEGYATLSRLADGSMRDGLSILERVTSSTDDEITAEVITKILGISDNEQIFSITDALVDGDINTILSIIDNVLSDGKDIKVFNDSLISHFRDLLVLKVSKSPEGILDYSADTLRKLKKQSEKLTFEKLSNAINILTSAQAEAKWVKSPRVIFELAYIKLSRPEIDNSPDALLDRMTTLEQKLNEGNFSPVSFDTSKINRKLEELEDRINNSAFKEEKSPVPQKKTEKTPPLRLYTPIPIEEQNANNPIVKHAKNWDNLVRIILNSTPHLNAALNNRPITIDRDGIIMLYKREESFLYKLAAQKREEIVDKFQKASRSSYTIKAAYRDDLEDNLVDFWSFKETDAKQLSKDPLDNLQTNFSSIVEDTDESEFVNYNSLEDNFSQSSIDDSDEREEFLTDEEQPSDE